MKYTEKSALEWLEFAKNLWESENKFVKSLLKFLMRTIKLSLKILAPAKINLSVEGGVEDPAETGWLYSTFVLLNSYFDESKRVSLEFIPQFEEPDTEGAGSTATTWKASGQIVYSFSIARLLFFTLLILISFPYLQAIKFWWRHRKDFK